ncbi:hypothetical protein IJS77_04560 [bacterium]|nr:hypothetical protein [bacterium]
MSFVNFGNSLRNTESNYSRYSRNNVDFRNNNVSEYNNTFSKQKKVGFCEAAYLVFKGIKDTAVNIVKSVVQHPIKTFLTMAATTAGLTILPFLGMSMATGGAVLAVGFGSLAIFNTAKNILAARKNLKNGNFDAMRKNLHNIGGNVVDLALTLPFMPKAIKHLKRNVPLYFQKDLAIYKNVDGSIVGKTRKYYGGTATFTYNPDGTIKTISEQNSLFTQMKNAKTWKERFNLLMKQDRTEAMYEQINKAYRQVAKERGINSAKDVRFNEICQEYRSLENGTVKKTCLGGWVDENFDTNRVYASTNTSMDRMCEIIGHEHRHVEQNEMMVRAGFIDKNSEFAHNFFADSLKKGKIKPGTQEYIQAQKFNEARLNYPKNYSASDPAYINNLLEVDARNVGETEIAGQIMSKLKSNMGIDTAKTITIDSAKYNPTKDIILSNGIVIKKQIK